MTAVPEHAHGPADVDELRAEVGVLRERLAHVEASAQGVEAALAYLATASVALAESLDVGATLDTLGNLIVPRLADWCAVHLADSDGSTRLAFVQHLDPDRADLLRVLLEGDAPDADGPVGVDAVLRSGVTAWEPRVSDGQLTAAARDEAHLEALRSLHLGSAITVALIARGHRIGLLTLLTEEGRPLGEAEVALAEELAARAAMALDNARLHEASQRAKGRLAYQTTLLKNLAEAGPDGVVVVSRDRRIIEFNRRFVEMWEMPDQIVDGGSGEDALAWEATMVEDPAGFNARVRELYQHPAGPTRDEVRLRDGRVFDRYGAPLVDEGGTYHGWAWYFRDVSEQKQWEQVLLESGERFASLARTLQESLLPPDLPELPGVELAARYHAAGRGVEVGGDFYDVFQTGRATWAIVMGDVCGKGAEAARTTGLARYTLRAAAMQERSPSGVLGVLNEALIRQGPEIGEGTERFVTAAYAAVRPSPGRVRLILALGGHPPPLIVRADGLVEPAGEPGVAAGLFPDPDLVDREVVLREGDLIVFYTDGVTEARDGGSTEEFGESRLRSLLSELAGSRPAVVAASVEAAALAHQGDEPGDDMAVLVLRVSPQT
jgi:serine phosphatase RsbU (regulator of sigma subunit)/PAS domain-containing protein